MSKKVSYDASDIEVLEGLEPVRKRPGMYIGGTDKNGMHHLFSEIIDNSMDEAVAGHANKISVEILDDNIITISDNGRGIPIDKHPKFPKKSALEVILTTLHAGGKFNNKVYQTSGGLHGVGISVVNALSKFLNIEVYRDKSVYSQNFKRGIPQGDLVKLGILVNGEPVDALAMMIHKNFAQKTGREVCEKLKDLIPRHNFMIPVQAAIGGKIIARETIKGFKKDVLTKIHGGGATDRKRKLLEKQKKGKARSKQFGRVEIPKEAFIGVLKIKKDEKKKNFSCYFRKTIFL